MSREANGSSIRPAKVWGFATVGALFLFGVVYLAEWDSSQVESKTSNEETRRHEEAQTPVHVLMATSVEGSVLAGKTGETDAVRRLQQESGRWDSAGRGTSCEHLMRLDERMRLQESQRLVGGEEKSKKPSSLDPLGQIGKKR